MLQELAVSTALSGTARVALNAWNPQAQEKDLRRLLKDLILKDQKGKDCLKDRYAMLYATG